MHLHLWRGGLVPLSMPPFDFEAECVLKHSVLLSIQEAGLGRG